MGLLSDIHFGLRDPPSSRSCHLIRGKYQFFHYLCDGFNDVGWGCGYRTLQTICSWLQFQNGQQDGEAPSIAKIQNILVEMEDKPQSFQGSRDWIGSVEVGLVIDKLFDVPCKILHIPSGRALTDHFPLIQEHFKEKASPVMMGGNQDAASKGILGTCTTNDNENYLLVLDPHCRPGSASSAERLQKEGYVQWIPLEHFSQSSFYNLCLPQQSHNTL